MTKEQSLAFDIGKEFHRICVQNRIPYYMLGGTMLGAVRHQGFIPWDDDMDFGIPREHFLQFVEICRRMLPERYKLLYHDNSTYAILGFAKIVDTTTIVHETYAPRTEEQIGINIDIFPLDSTNGSTAFLSFNNLIRSMFKLQKLLFFDAANRPLGKRILAQTAQLFIRIPPNSLLNYAERLINKRSRQKNGNMYCNFFGAWGLKELTEKQVMGTPTPYKFEDTELYGVENYDSYLSDLYGGYMVIPSERDRHVHINNIEYV